MESQTKSLSDYVAMLRRYKSRMFIVAITIGLVAIGLAIGLPSHYRSTGTILIEQQEMPQDMVRSTITSFADQRIHVISQRVMTRANLAAIIDKYNLYPDERKDDPMEVVLDKMRDSIKMDMVSADVVDPRNGRPTQATIAFTVSYDSTSREMAQKVANEIVSLYLNENLKSRAESANDASGFLTEEVKKLREHIEGVEAKLAMFKERNANRLPDLAQLNFQLMDRTDRDLIDAKLALRSLRERKSYLESQLLMISQDASVYTDNGERILGPSDRLKQLQVKYLRMVSIYGKDHPDLIRTSKEIESLKNEAGATENSDELRQREATVSEQLNEERRKYTPGHPEVKRLESELVQLEKALKDSAAIASPAAPLNEKSSNPAYIQIKSQLESANVELEVAEKRDQALREKLTEYESHMKQMPQVEREYRELIRDYENSSASFKELKKKQTEAQLSQMMESERKGERFTLVEPPQLPENPIKPNRLSILVLGVIFSIAGGVGTAAVSGSVDTAVYGTGALLVATGIRALVAIPCIETEAEIKNRKRRKQYLAFGFVVMIVLGLLIINFIFMPLDVLWYVIQRRMGMT